jgi:hypothetical protein
VTALARATVVGCALLGAAARVSAQPAESRSTVAVSYSYTQFAQEGSDTLPVGWLVSLGRDTNRTVSGIFEAGASYRPFRTGTLQIYTLQGGLRFAPARREGARPFVQALAGLGLARCCGDISPRLVFEPGGGVDIPISRRVSAQVAGGLMFVPDEGGTVPILRVKAGLSLALGR